MFNNGGNYIVGYEFCFFLWMFFVIIKVIFNFCYKIKFFFQYKQIVGYNQLRIILQKFNMMFILNCSLGFEVIRMLNMVKLN